MIGSVLAVAVQILLESYLERVAWTPFTYHAFAFNQVPTGFSVAL